MTSTARAVTVPRPDAGSAPALPGWIFVLPWDVRSPGGVNHVVLSLARQAIETGTYRPLVVCASWEDRVPRTSEFQGVTTVYLRLPAPDSSPNPLIRLARGARALLQYWRFVRLIRAYACGILNIHYVTQESLGILALARWGLIGAPVALSWHGTDILKLSDLGDERVRKARDLIALADLSVTCSGALLERLRTRIDPAHPAAVVHNGIEPARLDTVDTRPPEGFPGERRYVMSIAAFDPQKAHDVLVRAFAEVAEKHPDLDLVLVGGNAPTRPAVEALIEELGLARRVRIFVDHPHAQTMQILHGAAALVLASRSEAFGIVLLEAGYLGVPIVATRVGGIPEVVTDGETGLLVEPDDVAGLEHAIDTVLTDTDRAAQRARAMRARVGAQWTWSAQFERYRLAVSSASRPSGTAPNDTRSRPT